jgi:hypothetical protein
MPTSDLFEAPLPSLPPDAPKLRRVAALCVAPRSIYHQLPGVDAYDSNRDVRTFRDPIPIVAHPPCRLWSAHTRHQAKAPPAERELALICVDHLRRNGGILEHPAHSRLFAYAGLPLPGQRRGDLFTVAIHQSMFGTITRKRTWLCLAWLDPRTLMLPHLPHDSRAADDFRAWQLLSHAQRSATPEPLARWLVHYARQSTSPHIKDS